MNKASLRKAFYRAREIVKPWLVPSIRLSGFRKLAVAEVKNRQWVEISVRNDLPITIRQMNYEDRERISRKELDRIEQEMRVEKKEARKKRDDKIVELWNDNYPVECIAERTGLAIDTIRKKIQDDPRAKKKRELM